MRTKKLLTLVALAAVAMLTMGSGCPIAPEIKDKLVELAMGSSVADTLEAQGSINVDDEIDDFSAAVDLAGILDDAGVDPNDVTAIQVAGVSYRVIRKDPDDAREIQGGTVTIQREGGAVTPLVTNFDEVVNTVTSYKTAPLDPAGVTVLNTLLHDCLVAVQNNQALANPKITYHFSGVSAPTPATTDFSWAIKLDITITGKVKVKVIG